MRFIARYLIRVSLLASFLGFSFVVYSQHVHDGLKNEIGLVSGMALNQEEPIKDDRHFMVGIQLGMPF